MEKTRNKFSIAQLRKVTEILKYTLPYKNQFIVGFFLLLLSSLVVMVFPYLAGEMTDVAQGKSNLGLTLNEIGLVLIVVLVFQGIISYLRVIVFTYVSEKAMADVRTSLYEKLISLPIVFFEKNRVGELTSRITADVAQLQQVLSVTLAEFTRQILILVVGVILLLITIPRLSLIMLATFPLIVIAAFFFGRFIRSLTKDRQKKLASTNTVVDETLATIHTVKSFTNEKFEYKRYYDKIQDVVSTSLNLAKYRAGFGTFIIVVLFGGIFFLLWYGSKLVEEDAMSIGQLISFVVYTSFIGGAIASLGNFYTTIVSALGGTERIREILGEDAEISMEENRPVQRITGDIVFEDVEFEYPTREDITVLKRINMHIQEGHKIALVGASGAGKSTIAQLILRFYEVSRGDIQVGGQSIYSFPIDAYRHNIAIVPQEVILFGGTIRENILYGDPDASEEQVIEAAKKSNSWEFIQSFPEGLETIVGERGIKLSGGQRQRIAIARAILRNPSILILDEATSSLDAESEKIVQDALNTLLEGRTSIIIAHRLATIKTVDCIYVLDDGEIIEQGTHQELSELPNGSYSNLAKLQFELS